MYCKQCGSSIDNQDRFCGNCGSPISQNQATAPPSITPRAIENREMVPQPQAPRPLSHDHSSPSPKPIYYVWLIFLIAGIITALFAMAGESSVLVFFAFIFSAIGAIINLRIIFMGWKNLQPFRKPNDSMDQFPTPWNAVIGFIIPFYNIYWIFVVHNRLFIKLKSHQSVHGILSPSPWVARMGAALIFIPYVGFIFAIPFYAFINFRIAQYISIYEHNLTT